MIQIRAHEPRLAPNGRGLYHRCGMKTFDDNDLDPGRREVMRLLGSVAAAGMLGCANTGARAASESPTAPAPSGTCVVRPQQTEGPFFIDEKLNRSDLRSDPLTGTARAGVPLSLEFRVSRTSAGICGPLVGALVDVWQCDAMGSYSDVGGTLGTKFLRGYQVTDAEGRARFSTIYPGWYSGRTVHVHFKIRSAEGAVTRLEFTSQLYFDDDLTDTVHAQAPYNIRGRRDTTNASDGVFANGGPQLLLSPTPDGGGYAASFPIALLI
jgi:protocatechuate 3,4-dioxygenase beta subunit